MQFIHISDPHVDVLASHYGIDAARRFASAVVHAVARAPQAAFIAVTGDLTHNADEASYRFVQQMLSRAPCPSFVIPGNHDDPDVMAGVFRRTASVELNALDPREGGVWTDVLHAEGADALFLNTHEAGSAAGVVPPEGKRLLETMLMAGNDRGLFVFMHHPPFESGIAAMDAAGLANAEVLVQTFEERRATPTGIFCGHLHRTMFGLWQGVPVWCQRSTAHQVDPQTSQHETIGYCRETPEYGVVTYTRSHGGRATILSQSVPFENSEFFIDRSRTGLQSATMR